MKKKKNNVNNITIISIIIVLLVLCLSIGWSAINSSITLSSSALVRITTDIRITAFNSTTGTNGGVSQSSNYNTDYVTGSVDLPNSNSTITYQVEITNMELAANTYMGIDSLTGLPNNLEIKSISGYTLKSKICDDSDPTDCGSGSQKTFTITIGYKNNAYDANETSFGFVINFDFKKVFDITYTGFTNPPAVNTVMDGDTPTITFNSDAQNELNITSGGVTLDSGVDYTYSNRVLTFITPVSDHLFIANPAVYTISYVLNGGTQANNQITSYTVGVTESILSPQTRPEAVFNGWYLNSGFTGDAITDTSTLLGNVTLYAKWTNKVAMIGNTYYLTLQNAVNAATNNTNTTIDLIYDTSEHVTIPNTKIITINYNGHTLSNNGKVPVITNNGTLNMTNGRIATNSTQGAVNNNSVFNMSGGSIEATGTRQAIYNAGTVTISGTASLSSISNERATVQNLGTGTVIITGGTIISSQYSAVLNESGGTLRIGTSGGNVSTTDPLIRGATYGVENADQFDFYDGKIQGKTLAIKDETLIDNMESGYILSHTAETVSGQNYKTVYLASSVYTVTFDPGAGSINPNDAQRQIVPGGTVGALPTATNTGYLLEGWYDDDNDGHQITASEVINGNIKFYAHWKEPRVARIGSTNYQTIDDAWTAATQAGTATIVLLEDISLSDKLSVASGKNITFDLNGHNIDNTTTGTVFEVNGTLTIQDTASGGSVTGGKIVSGTQVPVIVNKSRSTVNINSGSISSNTAQVIDNTGTMNITGGAISIGNVTNGILNNNAGAILRMSGGSITAPISGSKRQAIYNKGTVYISGTATLSSNSTDRATVHNDASGAKLYISGGTITSNNSSCQRGAVQNASGGLVEITGGTITSKSTNNASGAVQNAGTLTLGTKDGTIGNTTPELIGVKYGVNNNGTFNFYDGITKGKTNSINGSVSDYEGTRVDTTGQIDGETYHITYYN